MIRYSYILGKTYQNWAIKTSKIDNLISEKLDAFGEYRLSEFAYNSALKLSNNIRISAEENQDESYKTEEVDVEPVNVSENINPFNEPIKNRTPNTEFELMESCLHALSLGGRNIYNSLISLSNLLKNIHSHSSQFLNERNSVVLIAIERYYNCELLGTHEFVVAEFPILFHHLITGAIGTSSVELIAKKVRECQSNLSEQGKLASLIRTVLSKSGISDDEYFNFIFGVLKKESNHNTIRESDIVSFIKENPYEHVITSIESSVDENSAAAMRRLIKYYGLQAIYDFMSHLDLDVLDFKALSKFELFIDLSRNLNIINLPNKEIIFNYINKIQNYYHFTYPHRLGGKSYEILDIVNNLSVQEFISYYNAGEITKDTSLRYLVNQHNFEKMMKSGLDPVLQEFFQHASPSFTRMYLEVGNEAISQFMNDEEDAVKKFFNKYRTIIEQNNLYSSKLLFDYISAYPAVDTKGENFNKELSKLYALVKEDILKFSPFDIKLIMSESDTDMKFSPEMILKYKSEYGENYFGGDNFPSRVNSSAKFLITMPKNEVDEFIIECTGLDPAHLFVNKYMDFAFIYYLFGKSEPKWEYLAKQFTSSANNYKYKDIFNEILKQDYFIGNLKDLIKPIDKDAVASEDESQNYFSKYGLFYGNYFPDKLTEEDALAKINQVKSSMEKTPAYRIYQEGSPEYQKIFHMIYNNYDLRSRDPKLLLGAFDEVVQAKSGAYFTHEIVSSFNTRLKPESSALFYGLFRTLDLSKIPDSEIQKIKVRADRLSRLPDGSNSFVTMMNLTSLIKELLDNNEVKRDDWINNNFELKSDADKRTFSKYIDQLKLILKDDNVKFLYDEDLNKLFTKLWIYLLTSDDYDKISILEAVEKCRSISDDLFKVNIEKFPEFYTNGVLASISSYKENIMNYSRIIQIFNLEADSIINQFAKKNIKKYQNYLTNKNTLSNVIHDLANILPSGERLYNFDKFFKKYNDNFDDEACRKLRYLGLSWNNVIKIADPPISGPVKELVNSQDIDFLCDTISLQSLRHLIGDVDIPKEEIPFAIEYARHNIINNDEQEDDHYDQMRKFQITKKVFAKGLKTKMPAYSSFNQSVLTSKNDKVELKFLPRNDPRGMFLGIYSRCCQHPTGHAASCAFDGVTNPKSAFLVCEVNGKLAAQAYVYSTKNSVVLDSIETIGDALYYSKNLQEAFFSLLKKFSSSLPEGISLHVGDSKIKLPTLQEVEAEENPTEKYLEHLSYFLNYTDAGDNEMYSDAGKQYLIPRD